MQLEPINELFTQLFHCVAALLKARSRESKLRQFFSPGTEKSEKCVVPIYLLETFLWGGTFFQHIFPLLSSLIQVSWGCFFIFKKELIPPTLPFPFLSPLSSHFLIFLWQPGTNLHVKQALMIHLVISKKHSKNTFFCTLNKAPRKTLGITFRILFKHTQIALTSQNPKLWLRLNQSPRPTYHLVPSSNNSGHCFQSHNWEMTGTGAVYFCIEVFVLNHLVCVVKSQNSHVRKCAVLFFRDTV